MVDCCCCLIGVPFCLLTVTSPSYAMPSGCLLVLIDGSYSPWLIIQATAGSSHHSHIEMCCWMQAHKQELQQQIAEKQAAAAVLQAEHARLMGRHSMLERILDTQESAVNILQGQEQVSAACFCIAIVQPSADDKPQPPLCHSCNQVMQTCEVRCWDMQTRSACSSWAYQHWLRLLCRCNRHC